MTHELCKGVELWSRERWDFWKKRFGELAEDAEGLEVGGDIVVRIKDALKTMEDVEK